jgi:hypothetical protein
MASLTQIDSRAEVEESGDPLALVPVSRFSWVQGRRPPVCGERLVERPEGRWQQVHVGEEERGYLRILSLAAPASALLETEEGPELFTWRRNHLSDLVKNLKNAVK